MFHFLPAKKAPGKIRSSVGPWLDPGYEPLGCVSPGMRWRGELRRRQKLGMAQSLDQHPAWTAMPSTSRGCLDETQGAFSSLRHTQRMLSTLSELHG